MDLALKVVSGVPEAGKVVPLPAGARLLLGRYGPEEGVHLTLTSLAINRKHCVVRYDEAGVWVRDLGGPNGTGVNGRWVEGEARLRPCEWLRVGPASLRLVWAGPVGPSWLAWNGGAVGALASSILTNGWSGQGGVLADALLDAGCEDEAVLAHCRQGCPQRPHCALIDLLLGVLSGCKEGQVERPC